MVSFQDSGQGPLCLIGGPVTENIGPLRSIFEQKYFVETTMWVLGVHGSHMHDKVKGLGP